jgi:hypothetical protein
MATGAGSGSLNAQPKAVRPQRRFEVYELEYAGRIVQLPCKDVDAAKGHAVLDGKPVTIRWKAERAA